jgi:hypothetical protein
VHTRTHGNLRRHLPPCLSSPPRRPSRAAATPLRLRRCGASLSWRRRAPPFASACGRASWSGGQDKRKPNCVFVHKSSRGAVAAPWSPPAPFAATLRPRQPPFSCLCTHRRPVFSCSRANQPMCQPVPAPCPARLPIHPHPPAQTHLHPHPPSPQLPAGEPAPRRRAAQAGLCGQGGGGDAQGAGRLRDRHRW